MAPRRNRPAEGGDTQPTPPSRELLTAELEAQFGATEQTAQEFFPSTRRVKGVAPELAQIIANEGRITNVPIAYGGRGSVYNGQYLVDETGVIRRGQYDAKNEGLDVLATLAKNPLTLKYYQSILKSRGLYGRSKPSDYPLASSNLSAIQDLLMYANTQGLTYPAALAKLTTEPPVQEGGVGRAVKVTAREDVMAYLDQQSLKILGRKLTRADADRAIAAIQGRERATQLAGVDTPSLSVLAEKQVLKAAPEEARLNGIADGIDILRSLLMRG
jgi:hypothetical protein